jgi:hypothetical protein
MRTSHFALTPFLELGATAAVPLTGFDSTPCNSGSLD